MIHIIIQNFCFYNKFFLDHLFTVFPRILATYQAYQTNSYCQNDFVHLDGLWVYLAGILGCTMQTGKRLNLLWNVSALYSESVDNFKIMRNSML
jgi:hypothetical protein